MSHAARMDAAPSLALAVIVISAGASFFFALAETALFSLSKWQVRQLADRDSRLGAVAVRLLAEPQDVLATMVLGNTFAGAAMVAVGLWMALNETKLVSVPSGNILNTMPLPKSPPSKVVP